MPSVFPRPEAVVWDMDGVIFDTERLRLDAWEELLAGRGYTDVRATFLRCLGKNINESNETLFQAFGHDFPVQQLRVQKDAMVEARMDSGGLPVMEGVRETLAWLHDHGVPSAIASSTYVEKIHSYLSRAMLAEHFRVIVGGDQISKSKPHPEIFLLAADKLGTTPEKCLAFEDSPNGVLAAHMAGMQVVLIPDLIEPPEDIRAHAHHFLPSLRHAVPLLEKLMAETNQK